MPTHRRRGRVPGTAASFVEDPLTGRTSELQRVQPYQARKEYICPGCNQEIRIGTGHVVVVPLNEPESRRHWHTPCQVRAFRHGMP
ncbi:MAG: hypothetical protein ACLPQS_06045 [Acidimicrobiales bacterium]